MKSFFYKTITALTTLYHASATVSAASNTPLQILNVTYGDLNMTSGVRRVDLTQKAREMLRANQLVLQAGSKFGEFGIPNPTAEFFPGTTKNDTGYNTGRGFLIVYSVGSDVFCSITNDSAAVSIPNANDQKILSADTPLSAELNIIKAFYGDLNIRSLEEGGQQKQIADVTTKTQSMVQNEQLALPKSTKNNFYGDPAIYIVKGFLVFFAVNQKLYMQFGSEYDEITISGSNLQNAILLSDQQTAAELAAQQAAAKAAAAEQARIAAEQQAAAQLAAQQTAEKAAANAAAQAAAAQKALADQEAATKAIEDQIALEAQRTLDAQKKLDAQRAATKALEDAKALEAQKILDAQNAIIAQQAAEQAAIQQAKALAEEQAIASQLSGINSLSGSIDTSAQSLSTRTNTINDALKSLSEKLDPIFSKLADLALQKD